MGVRRAGGSGHSGGESCIGVITIVDHPFNALADEPAVTMRVLVKVVRISLSLLSLLSLACSRA